MIKLNQQLERIEIDSFQLDNKVVFQYINSLPATDRDEKFLKAIYIGVLALMEDRLSAFLAKTSNELGTELESLKMIFDMKTELFYKSSIKGTLAEEEIAEFLNKYFSEHNIKDKVYLTGNIAGTIQRNKTGDIICELDGKEDSRISIECKFDKSIRLGDIENKDIFVKKSDTAWSQLIESQVNRNAKISIIVFDISLVDNSILRKYENVGYVPGIGLIAVVNSQKGDYTNLAIAYTLARNIALSTKNVELDKDILLIMITRIIKDIYEIITIKTLIESNIENNKAILKQLEKSILLMEFNHLYLKKFLEDGTFTKTDLLNFYSGEDVKSRFSVIEKDINLL